MKKPSLQARGPHGLVQCLLLAALGTPFPALAAPPADSPYAADPQESYVQDETGEAIGSINNIMCIMSSMRPDLMVNQGVYAAMIDGNACEEQGGNGSTAPDYIRALVDAQRDSVSDPMSTRVWLENREDDQTIDIFVRIALSQGPSASLPYGAFRLDYGAAPMPGQSDPLMQGYLQSDANGLSFVERGNFDNPPRVTQLSLQAAPGGSGHGALRYPDWSTGQPRTMTFGYDATHFRRFDGTNDRCFTRSLAQAKTSVWRYGLYDEVTGERVDRNGGFPFVATIDGQRVHGYLGYHGLSAPPDALAGLVTGTTIERESHEGGTAQGYTLIRNGGKLMRHAMRTRPLVQADGLAFETWADPAWPNLPQEVSGRHVRMSWSESGQSFVIDARMNCDQNGCNLAELDAPVVVAGAAMASAVPHGLSGHAPQLNGQIHIPAEAMTDSSQSVRYRASQLVHPGELATGTALYCIDNCPTAPGLAQLAAGSAQDPHDGTAFRYEPVAAGAVRTYQVDSAGVLTESGQPVVFAGTEEDLRGTSYGWGIQSGRLVTDMAALECEQGAAMYCAHRADALDVYYTWETGPHPWNGYAGARDGEGQLVAFEAPLRVVWQVPADAGPYGDYAGKALVLQYSNFGDLHGLPSYCVDPATNAQVPCGTPNSRWVPVLSIPHDATDGAVTVEGGSDRYLVKWLNREVRFAPVAGGACAGITLGDVASLPGTDSLVDPSDPSSSAYIGPKPEVTDAPRIIHGVLQD